MKQWLDAFRSMGKAQKLALFLGCCLMMLFCVGNRSAQDVFTDEERRLAEIIAEMDGVRKATVMVSYDANGQREGAVVALRSKMNIRTMLEIERAIQTLTGLPLDQIEVVNTEPWKG